MNNGSSKGLYSHAKASALKSFGSDTLKERQNRAVLSLSLSLSLTQMHQPSWHAYNSGGDDADTQTRRLLRNCASRNLSAIFCCQIFNSRSVIWR